MMKVPVLPIPALQRKQVQWTNSLELAGTSMLNTPTYIATYTQYRQTTDKHTHYTRTHTHTQTHTHTHTHYTRTHTHTPHARTHTHHTHTHTHTRTHTHTHTHARTHTHTPAVHHDWSWRQLQLLELRLLLVDVVKVGQHIRGVLGDSVVWPRRIVVVVDGTRLLLYQTEEGHTKYK